MDKISPCLWFNGNAEEAVSYYVSVFPDSRIDAIARWPMDREKPAPAKKGDVLAIDFTLGGHPYKALNGGVDFPFTEAISLVWVCKDQAEIDKYWNRLVKDGGQEIVCGWLKDKYGLCWQIAPQLMYDLLVDKDTAKAARAMTAMMQMVKIDIATIENAAKG
jgi:predicted 3-demethylubiquinone-9 3-methyltransferase (glyoxalase superfamily)